ncbi:odorant-binding protein 2b isoform X2 [Saccopteryx bilineata]|uniref:odorant-binding protein 2b isoform X2 n=1 Tax=Saccopteryx bilineata TaxID=59482 RepID=UPI00338FBD49
MERTRRGPRWREQGGDRDGENEEPGKSSTSGGRKRMDIEQLPVRDRYILSCEGPHHGQGLPTPGKTQGVNPPLQDPAALGQSPGNWGNCLLPETWGSPGHLPCRWKS